MSPRHPRHHRNLVDIAYHLAVLQTYIDGAVAAIEAELDDADGYPRSCIGAGPATVGNPATHTCTPGNPEDCDLCFPVSLTTVEAAALAHRRPTGDLRRLTALLALSTKAMADASRIVTRWNPPAVAATCSRGVGREGQIQWGDPLCDRVAADDRGGLCLACAKREQRWRRDAGLPSRAEVAA